MNISFDKSNWLLCPVSRLSCAVCVFFSHFFSGLIVLLIFRCIDGTYYWNWGLNQMNIIVIIKLDWNGGDWCSQCFVRCKWQMAGIHYSHSKYSFVHRFTCFLLRLHILHASVCVIITHSNRLRIIPIILWHFSVHKCQWSRWSRWIFQNIAFRRIIGFFFSPRYLFSFAIQLHHAQSLHNNGFNIEYSLIKIAFKVIMVAIEKLKIN